jgi:hypothetical protein
VYCGAGISDPLLISKDIEREHRELGIDSVMNCFSPEYILKLLNYDNFQLDSYPPCWLKMPFQARDAVDDDYVRDPGEQYARSADYFDPTMDDMPMDCDDGDKRKAPPDTSVEYKHASKRSRRASPSNQARYPRPPSEIKTLADAIAMGRYAAAGGLLESSEEPEFDELDAVTDELDLVTDEVLDFYEDPLKVTC